MPYLESVEEEAPEIINRNGSANGRSSSTSTIPSIPDTLLTTSTPSSPGSLSSPSPETSALFRILSGGYDIGVENSGHQRVVFPREQTLLELLFQSTGVQDLHQLRQIKEVKLRVVAEAISLSRLETYAPYIRILRLDGSGLTSLREIGTSLQHLKILHVSRCGLTNLDGTFGLANLIELHAADNYINNVGPCTVLENIKVINLDGNPITSMTNLSLLSLCPCLSKLSIRGTPVSRQNGYRNAMKDLMPNLKKLDGSFMNDHDQREDSVDRDEDSGSFKSIDIKTDGSNSCSFEVSSMTDPSSEEVEESSSKSMTSDSEYNSCKRTLCEEFSNLNYSAIEKEVKPRRRPATALGLPSPSISFMIPSMLSRRPFTALSQKHSIEDHETPIFPDAMPEATPSFLTSGGIVCGNIGRALSRARPARRPLKPSSTKPIDAWVIGPPSKKDDEIPLDQIEQFDDKGETSQSLPISRNEDKSIVLTNHNSVLEDAKKILDMPLPTKPLESTPVIDLEMGVTGSISPDSSSIPVENSDIKWEESSQRAIRASKQWRRAFKLYRRNRRASTDSEGSNSNTKVDEE